VLGVWHKGADGTDVNTTDRSPSHECLATGDDRGLVSLFRYPALGGRGKVYGGHSSHVTAVRTLTLTLTLRFISTAIVPNGHAGSLLRGRQTAVQRRRRRCVRAALGRQRRHECAH
jgi:hypothetical protein